MTPSQKKIALAVGITAGIGLLAGVLLLSGGDKVDKRPEGVSQIQDDEIRRTSAYLLQYEGSTAVLRDIAGKLRAAGYPNLANALDARAAQLGA